MRKTTSDKPRGIQWTLFSQLQDLDFADDLAFLSVKLDHLQEKTDRLERDAKQTGLTINTSKTQVMSINTTPTAPVTVNGEPLQFVQDFNYLGSLISKDNGGQKDIKARLGKARCAFAKLQNIWKSNQYTTKTKIRLYNSNVKSILLYGSECWRVVKGDMAKVDAFHNRCLRKICRIFWPNKISNVDLCKKTGCNSAVLEIKRRRLRWLGHVLRMPQDSIPKVALRWTPPRKRKRQSVMAELKEMGLSCGEAQASAKDRTLWRSIVVALCPTGDEEDKINLDHPGSVRWQHYKPSAHWRIAARGQLTGPAAERDSLSPFPSDESI
ncbi:hypothetical protein NP493_2181g00005 [Ridgeia piscesae]|uniref:Reverse transcriptase domain-containing protein n=1 Tax=Ridgeia piscesae TaxID=27915 RepID=A0AAD9JJS3_RIDPI|nr:hypothetical protein NP493_2181g00005 [Ridgeia piscesae]